MSRRAALAVKRAIDLVGGVALAVLTSPVMAGVALAVKLDSRGSVLFSQHRAGLHGKPFRIYKFRTMVTDEEAHRDIISLDDRRITRVGRFLRGTSLDELPQLLNVVIGDMSLVGPRPQLIGTTRDHERRRFDMRPGMTGLVEVSKPHLLTWDDRMALDVRYVEQWSLLLDLSILARTIPVMLARKNALEPPRT
jgi:lipopolysaccharide/colanic/teichoic acid biosynthesis glycosyltransferase